MLDSILKVIDYLRELSPAILRPLEVKVEAFYLQLMGSTPYDVPTVITAWSKRYHVDMLLHNRTNSVVYIRSIILSVGDRKTYKPTKDVTEFRLESQQAKRISLVFNVSEEKEPPKEGIYELRVAPTSGRKTINSGCFPTHDN